MWYLFIFVFGVFMGQNYKLPNVASWVHVCVSQLEKYRKTEEDRKKEEHQLKPISFIRSVYTKLFSKMS